MKFIFDKTNQSYFHRLYDKTFREGGWRAVPRLTWHMIYRNKRLDDNGPMGASLITLNQRHPDEAFQQYVETTNHHLMVSEPRLADGTIARLWPHEILFGQMMRLWRYLLFLEWERLPVKRSILMMRPIRY